MILLLLIFLAGMFKAVMDVLQFHYSKSIFEHHSDKFWDPSVSWINKWKNSSAVTPRFFGSTTFLVWVTDGWHLFQMLFLSSIFLALVNYTPIVTLYDCSKLCSLLVNYTILRVIFACSFTLFYDHILVRK